MKIVSWNCGGGLRKKLNKILALDADILIIQECEDPAQSNDKNYKAWAINYLWHGYNKNKGIGVFAKSHLKLIKLPFDAGKLELFLPFTVDNLYILAVWTKDANSAYFKYIGQLWKYLQLYKNEFKNRKSIIIGDWNSNTCWDKWDSWWNHSDVIKELDEIGLVSLYHEVNNERQGEESQPTFYMYRNINKPYHIDYALISKEIFPSSSIAIGQKEEWLEHSDHMPLLVGIKII